MAHVLVIGASRGIGLETVHQALAAGHRVRAFARTARRLPVEDAGLEKQDGDALRAEDVVSALDDVDAVILALGADHRPKTLLCPTRLFSDATRILLPAMAEAGVRRLIAVTGFGAGDSGARMGCLQRIPFRLALGRIYDDKSRQERLIRDSDLDWTIVRPVILTDGPRTGRYHVLVDPDEWRNGIISRADVADFLVRQIDDDALLHATPVIAG